MSYKSRRFSFLTGTLLVFCFVFFVRSAVAKSGDFSGQADKTFKTPQYSILYDQLLRLEKHKKYLEALRLIPEIYRSQDIPVDAFYVTLNKKRQALLNTIIDQNISFNVTDNGSPEELTCSDFQQLSLDRIIGKPETYRFIVPHPKGLDFSRLCYLLITEAYLQNNSSKGAPVFPTNSLFNLRPSLESDDPWLVSAALYFSRKQKNPTVTPQTVIDRWEKRPNFWDEQCTQQAVLLLAQLDSTSLKKLTISNEDISLALEDLKRVPLSKSYVSPLLFSAVDNHLSYIDQRNMTLIKLEKNKQIKGVIKRWAGDKNQFSNLQVVREKKISAKNFNENDALLVKPGYYRIDFNTVEGNPPSGYSGKSAIVEVKAGEFMIVPVEVFPAI